jgi:hypothetical protein
VPYNVHDYKLICPAKTVNCKEQPAMQLLYIHWNQHELDKRIRSLNEMGYQVYGLWQEGHRITQEENNCDVLIVSLDRLPSHGRSVAQWFSSSKKRQHIPILFTGGRSELLEPFREQFTKAIFVRNEDLPAALEDLHSLKMQ